MRVRGIVGALALFCLAGMLAAGTAWGQVDDELDALFPAPPSNAEEESAWEPTGYPLSTLLRRVWVQRALVRQQRTVVPLTLSGADPLPQSWLLASEAMKQGHLRVCEQGGVPQLMVENRSSKCYVFVPAGQVFDGGMQNRSLAEELALAPGQRSRIPVFCVEAGRWSGSHAFRRGQYLAPPSLRMTILSGQGQRAVWDHVAWVHRGLAIRPGNGNLLLAYHHPRVRRTMRSFRRNIQQRLPKRTIGVVLLYRGEFIAAELFGSQQLARAALPQVLDAFYLESLLPRRLGIPAYSQRPHAPSGPLPPDRLARQLVALLAEEAWQRSHRSGVGEVWTLETPRFFGRGLTCQGRPVHLLVLPKRGFAVQSNPFPP